MPPPATTQSGEPFRRRDSLSVSSGEAMLMIPFEATAQDLDDISAWLQGIIDRRRRDLPAPADNRPSNAADNAHVPLASRGPALKRDGHRMP